MALPGPIPGIDLIGESIGAIISLLITYYAYKAYRLSGQRTLFLLYVGFLLIGVGFISQSVALLLGAFLPSGTPIVTLRGLERLLFTAVNVGSEIRWVLEILGYIAIFVAYLYQTRDTQSNNLPAAGTVAFQIIPSSIARLIFNPPLELIIFLLLLFILIQVTIIYIPRRHRTTLYVVLGFLFLALAHLTFLLFAFLQETIPVVYALGHILQLAGFLLLLAMLLSTTRGK